MRASPADDPQDVALRHAGTAVNVRDREVDVREDPFALTTPIDDPDGRLRPAAPGSGTDARPVADLVFDVYANGR